MEARQVQVQILEGEGEDMLVDQALAEPVPAGAAVVVHMDLQL